MTQYIDKTSVVDEIKKRISEYENCGIDNTAINAKIIALQSLLIYIEAFEVKEVDLEKYLKESIEDIFFDLDGVAVKGTSHYITVEDVKYIVKNFFELGLKAHKGE